MQLNSEILRALIDVEVEAKRERAAQAALEREQRQGRFKVARPQRRASATSRFRGTARVQQRGGGR